MADPSFAYLVVDRMEGDWAVCEQADRSRIVIPLEQFSWQPREGDVFWQTKEGYRFAAEETQRRRQENARKLARLLEQSGQS